MEEKKTFLDWANEIVKGVTGEDEEFILHEDNVKTMKVLIAVKADPAFAKVGDGRLMLSVLHNTLIRIVSYCDKYDLDGILTKIENEMINNYLKIQYTDYLRDNKFRGDVNGLLPKFVNMKMADSILWGCSFAYAAMCVNMGRSLYKIYSEE